MRLALFALVLLLAAPAAASAATRYAAPGANGPEPCVESAPCDLERAVEDAPNGSEVIVAPGDYQVAGGGICTQSGDSDSSVGALHVDGNTTVRGVRGRPRPRIVAAASECTTVVALPGNLTHLEVVNDTPTVLSQGVAAIGTLDGLVVRSKGLGVHVGANTVVRNSFVITNGGSGVQGSSTNIRFRNVTTTGSADINRPTATNASGQATNVIALGGFHVFDFGGGGGTITFTVDHSYGNLGAGVTDGGNNHSGAPAPQFVNAANGDYHLASGSSVGVDDGVDNTENGGVDFDGGLRTNGVTDIGADEFGAALANVTTAQASAIGPSSATLEGVVDSNGVGAGYNFEYGPTIAYGNSSPDGTVGADFADHAVSANVSGLMPLSTYHYRLVAQTADGPSFGLDRTFTTGAPSGSGGGGGGGGGSGTGGGGGEVVTPSNAFTLGAIRTSARGTATATLTLPGPGIVSLLATASTPRGAARTIRVARVRKQATRAGRLSIAIRPSRAAKRLLARRGRLRSRARVTYTPTGGTPRTKTKAFTLKLRRARR